MQQWHHIKHRENRRKKGRSEESGQSPGGLDGHSGGCQSVMIVSFVLARWSDSGPSSAFYKKWNRKLGMGEG